MRDRFGMHKNRHEVAWSCAQTVMRELKVYPTAMIEGQQPCFPQAGTRGIALQSSSKPLPLGKRLQRYWNRANVAIGVAWVILIALGIYISTCTLKQQDNFDPFEILGLDVTADSAAIKRAYKQLSKVWHPDKISDPVKKQEAAKFFAEKLSKAYKTLTDEAARENWVKYGHPDGPQVRFIICRVRLTRQSHRLTMFDIRMYYFQ